MANEKKMRLGDILIDSGLITPEQLSSALEVQKSSGGQRLGQVLVGLGVLTEEQVLGALQKRLGVPLVTLEGAEINENLLSAVPESLASEKTVFPYKRQGNTLYVATSDPLDYEALNDISAATGYTVEPVIATKERIISAIDRYYHRVNIGTMAERVSDAAKTSAASDVIFGIDELEVENRLSDVPVVKFINNVLVQAYSRRASDIHIEPGENSLRVRFRIDGDLVQVLSTSMVSHPGIVTRVKIMGGMDIAEKRVPLDGRFTTEADGIKFNVRVASMPTIYGEKLVLRLLTDSNEGIMPFEQLGMEDDTALKLREAMASPNGLILVTGPTGSGKSTTLYSVLNEISTVGTNIVTIEDPVEKIIQGVNQTQTNDRAGLTFASSLRAVLRQDPDKIMVGEIRDAETADTAARAAITGHLVFASLHTNSAASAFMRLVDMGVEPYIIASSVICVVAQRLVKLICPHCRHEVEPSAAQRAMIEAHGFAVPEKVYEGAGCEACEYTGYYGRVGVYEIIRADATIRDMILQKVKDSDIEEYLKTKGQRFLIDSAMDLVREGRIAASALYSLTNSWE